MATESGSSAEVERAGETEGETEELQPAKRVIWTPERLAKAAATRAETKRKKEEKFSKKLAKLGKNSAADTLGDLDKVAESLVGIDKSNGFDWERAPLAEASARYADLKRELDKAGAILLKRQSVSKPQWTCWSQLNKDIVQRISPSILKLCRKTGDEGRWAFRDDGVFKVVDGLRVPDPAFCCNTYCFEVYQKAKPMAALSRH